MQVVWKESLALVGRTQELLLPVGAKIVRYDSQYDEPTIWFECDDAKKERESRRFIIVGTGNAIPHGAKYIGTAMFDGGKFVFHLYELVKLTAVS